MSFHVLIERIRDRQFFIPGVFIVAALAGAWITNRLDDLNPEGANVIFPSSVRATRTLLATTAGATITVAALVFSFTAVAVQLSASQYSPRVVDGFLRDRFQQFVVGVLMGTFTYAVVGLATIGVNDADISRADWTASTAVVLAVAAAVAVVGYIDHVTRRLRVDDTVRRIAEQTREAFGDLDTESAPDELASWNLRSETDDHVVRSHRSGFVQRVDLTGLMGDLPDGAVARLDTWTGCHVLDGSRLLTVWLRPGEEISEELLRDAIVIGETRTISQDPAFGIRQLVDIALRALSPGINDPATAADVVSELAGCVRTAALTGNARRLFTGDDDKRLAAPHIPQLTEIIEESFRPICRAGAEHPMVMRSIVDSLTDLLDQLGTDHRASAALEAEVEAARSQLEAGTPA